MTKRYEATYSAGPEPKTLIFPEGTYEALPFEVRLMAPWYGCYYIESKDLKPAQRYELMRQGYTLIWQVEKRFSDAA